jgi:cytochrome c-type biogenesis protein CcmE
MTPRRKRLFVVLGILGGVAASVSLAVMASRENIMFYFDPTQVVEGKAPQAKRFRIGGMVVKGSVERKPGDLSVRFVLTDFAHQVPVEYTGVLPDLFREGQGIIAHGTMNQSGAFVADEVLAKHDEKYMPSRRRRRRRVVRALRSGVLPWHLNWEYSLLSSPSS